MASLRVIGGARIRAKSDPEDVTDDEEDSSLMVVGESNTWFNTWALILSVFFSTTLGMESPFQLSALTRLTLTQEFVRYRPPKQSLIKPRQIAIR